LGEDFRVGALNDRNLIFHGEKEVGRMRDKHGRIFLFFLAFLGLLTMTSSVFPGGAVAEVKLEVLDPRGELYTPPVQSINPRLSSLAGKKIGIMNNGKAGLPAAPGEGA
jgi:hypothetical protein